MSAHAVTMARPAGWVEPSANEVEIVEVATRDGFQSVGPLIETSVKVGIAAKLLSSGVSRLETGAFVSPKAVPQMADTTQLFKQLESFRPTKRLSALIATANGGMKALNEGVSELVFVVSVSESHNQSNVRRSVDQSLGELADLIARAPAPFVLRLNLATCFDCPFEGRVPEAAVLALIGRCLQLTDAMEIGLCDTTGKALPLQVRSLCTAVAELINQSHSSIAFHGHDTYGFGVTNALMAVESGVRVIDGAAAGLGGCPFAPGASGNTATEDLIYMLEGSGYKTGVQLESLLDVADEIAAIDGANTGGHIRSVPRERLLSNRQAVAGEVGL